MPEMGSDTAAASTAFYADCIIRVTGYEAMAVVSPGRSIVFGKGMDPCRMMRVSLDATGSFGIAIDC